MNESKEELHLFSVYRKINAYFIEIISMLLQGSSLIDVACKYESLTNLGLGCSTEDFSMKKNVTQEAAQAKIMNLRLKKQIAELTAKSEIKSQPIHLPGHWPLKQFNFDQNDLRNNLAGFAAKIPEMINPNTRIKIDFSWIFTILRLVTFK
eukprot:TRINITY_DN3312_c0_g1_i1.p2 TRINITY_DN3312_c0_g1~~TRINITY_DN3312_c0_g1_i1.p2  ORF type:complete len:151 (-),score=23.77 TRINITY_DN3312_c0_g1_i1:752-1204(-)